MSLFPAYSVAENDEPAETENGDVRPESPKLPTLFPSFQSATAQNFDEEQQSSGNADWLQNNSYRTAQEEPVITLDSSKSDSDRDLQVVYEKKKTKKRKKKQKKEKHGRQPPVQVTKLKPQVPKKPVWTFADPDPADGICPITMDRWRDLENLQFNTLYKRHTPQYDYLQKRCLGADAKTQQTVFGSDATNKALALRYFSRRVVKRSKAANVVRMGPRQVPKLGLGQFVQLIKPKIIAANSEELIYDASIQMYRPVEANLEDETASADPQTLTKLMNQRLHEDPHNVPLWLTFIEMQPQLAENSAISEENQPKLTERAVLERQMAILDRALAKNATNVELKLLRLRLGNDLWLRDKVRDEWRKMEFAHINQPGMWRAYLSFAEHNFSDFTVSKQLSLYDRALTKLQSVLSGSLLSHSALPETESFLLECIFRRCYFLDVCGHNEKAWANLQALVEFNFFAPPVGLELEQKRELFESFWESNCARFGENASLGWAATKSQATETNDTEIGEIEDNLCGTHESDGLLWVELERTRQSRQWQPMRSSEEDPEDLERVVLSDDVHSSLILFKESSVRFRLLLDLLAFLGVRLTPLQSSNELPRNEWNNLDLLLQSFPDLPPVGDDQPLDRDKILQQMFTQIDGLYATEHQRSYFASAQLSYLSETYLKCQVSTKEKRRLYKRAARDILKSEKNRSCFPVYLSYAQGLAELEAFSEAAEVLSAALCAQPFWQQSDQSQQFLIGLNLLSKCLQYQLLADIPCLEVAASVASYVLNNVETSTVVLKTKRALESRLQEAIASYKESLTDDNFLKRWLGSMLVHLSGVAAFFSYVAGGGCLASGVAHFESAVDAVLSAKSALLDSSGAQMADRDLELIFEQWILLHEIHEEHSRVVSPRQLRSCLESALLHFPNNPDFLRKFVDASLRAHRIVELRRYFATGNNRHNSSLGVVRCLALLYAEFKRYVSLVDANDNSRPTQLPEIHRIRQVFERAVESDVCCPLLWRLYFKFESLRGDSAAAQRLFYRAVRRCPYAKQLYVDAARVMPDKVQMITDLMVEKELRLRVPLEELAVLRRAAQQNTIVSE